MKKIALLMLVFASLILADDYSTPSIKSGTVRMQTLVGEAAVNNVLMARFGGRHALSVAGQDNIILFVNKLGIDIQGKDEVVFGFDLEIGNNIVKGDIPVRGAFSIRQLADAYVVLMNLNDVLEDVLTGYGINSLPIKSAVKTFFSSADGKIELWRQKFGALLDNYFNNLEKKYDLFVADEPNIELLIGDKPDNIAINLEMVIKSEKQYFWVDNMILSSNKKFELMDIVKKHLQDQANHYV